MEPPASDDFKSYGWRPNGKILVTIFSQTFPLQYGDIKPHEKKILTEDKEYYDFVDVDAEELKHLFGEAKTFPVPVKTEFKPLQSFDEVKAYFKEIDSKEGYDCFFFVFLTYSNTETDDNAASKETFSNEKLHFNDESKDKGFVPEAMILDEVKSINATKGKPKIFLIQADDLRLLYPKKETKGPTVVPYMKKRKIPQDADRLIIKSNIPQRFANLDSEGDFDFKAKNPSFLVQAFVKAMRENGRREDLLSLSTRINGHVAGSVAEFNHCRSGDMMVPLVTSTLTQLLHL